MSRNRGWIRLSRKLFDGHDRFWPDDREFTRFEAWIDLIQEAEWRDRTRMIDGQTIDLERGQLIASQRFLAERWNWSTGKVRRYLELLVDLDRIEWETNHPDNHLGAIITIVNYDRYQSSPSETNRETNHQRTTNEPPTNRNLKKLNEEEEGEEQTELLDVADQNGDLRERLPPADQCPRNDRHQIIYPKPFEDWFEAYPDRDGGQGKKDAYKRYRKLRIEENIDQGALIEAADHYRRRCRGKGDRSTIKMASTFLGPGDHWREELEMAEEGSANRNRLVGP